MHSGEVSNRKEVSNYETFIPAVLPDSLLMMSSDLAVGRTLAELAGTVGIPTVKQKVQACFKHKSQ